MKNEFLIKRDKAIFINYGKSYQYTPRQHERTNSAVSFDEEKKNELKARGVRRKEININIKVRASNVLSINKEKEKSICCL